MRNVLIFTACLFIAFAGAALTNPLGFQSSLGVEKGTSILMNVGAVVIDLLIATACLAACIKKQ